jgi:thiamine biosynthesis lipoprotein
MHLYARRRQRMRLAILLFSLCGLLATGARCDDSAATDTIREFDAFATPVRIEILAAAPAPANQAADGIERYFQQIGRDWYAFGDGELARVNANLSRGEPATLSTALLPLVMRAIQYQQRSEGLFDPGVCALVKLWRFDRGENVDPAGTPPATDAVNKLHDSQGSVADLQIEGHTLRSRRPLCIDLGGMAKGTALEGARQLLAKHGIRHALVDIGGSSLLGIGNRPAAPRYPARRWRIGLLDPRTRQVYAALELAAGEGASTSGDYERAYTAGEQRYHHILDPRSGRPSSSAASVTVIAMDAELADVASTALMVGGPDRFTALVERLGLDYALLVSTTGELHMTPAMRERLKESNAGRLPKLDWQVSQP